MKKTELINLLARIEASYPNWHPRDRDILMDTWYQALQDIPYQAALGAFLAYLTSNTSGFAPGPANIRSMLYMRAESNDPTAEEEWSKVSSAIRRGSYHAEEEFNKLSPLTQKAIGSPSNIRNLATSDIQTVETVEKSHFIRTYNTLLESEKVRRRMPADVQNGLGLSAPVHKQIETTDRMELEDRKQTSVPMPDSVKNYLEELRNGKA